MARPHHAQVVREGIRHRVVSEREGKGADVGMGRLEAEHVPRTRDHAAGERPKAARLGRI